MTIYQCSNCDSEVKKGTHYCPQCGNKLEWPKKKNTKKSKKSKKLVRLNVDPFAVDELYESMVGLGIGMLLFGGFGIITGSIALSQRRTIGKWLQHLMSPNYYPGIKTSTMLKKVKTIRSCCSWSVAGNIVFGIGSLGNMSNSATPSFVILILSIIGIVICEILSAMAQKVLKSSVSGNEYTFDRTKKYNDDDYSSTSYENDDEDDDDDDDDM